MTTSAITRHSTPEFEYLPTRTALSDGVSPGCHNPKVAGSNPAPATNEVQVRGPFRLPERASLVNAL